jgi:two-component system, cell cycle sensor histidine kinase and response regulator CckA
MDHANASALGATPRREDEEPLDLPEEQFRTIFDSVGDGVAISEPGGNFLEVNRVVCERLGYTREQLLNMPVRAINSPESAATIAGRVAEIMQGRGVRPIEATHVRRDGSEMPIEAVSRRITFRGKPAILSVYRDITERKRAEEEIASSVARLQIAMGAMLDGVGILSAVRDGRGCIVDFRIDYTNAAMSVISGVAAEQQVGHTLLELFPAHRTNGLFEAYVRVVETGAPFSPADFRYADPDAEGGPLDKILDQRVARLGDGIILSVRDVTEVERMRQERERLAAIVEESPDGMLVTDAEERIVYVNSAFAHDLGRKPADVVGLRALELVDGVLDAAKTSAIVGVVRSGEPWQGEADWRLPDGTLGRVDLRIMPRLAADGTIEGHLIVARDATERKRIQTALELSELKYSTAFRTSPDAVNLNRLSDGLYIDISDGFTATTGFTRDEVVGKTSAEIAIWADPETRDRLVAGLRDNGVVHNMAMRFRRKDGSLGDALMSARVIEVNGEPCILSITRDITDRTEAEERFRTERRVLQDQLTQAQKLEAIGRLAGGVAHDFNNLLTAIRGFAELHLAEHEPDDPGRADVLEIEQAADRATQLTKGLLAFSRRAEVHPVPLDIAGLVHDTMALLRRLVGEDVAVHLDAGPKVPLVFADPVQIEQVLLNLAANARDAMPTGGSLGIEVKGVLLDDGFVSAHPGSATGHHVLLAVSDTGIGMDETTQEHIFEPFFTTKPSGEGTGLGLASVYGIVRQAGGYIDVDSRLGGGSLFRAYLPAVQGDAPQVESRQSAGHPRPEANQTILLVEDEPAVRLFAQRVLTDCGYRVMAFGDPSLALDFAIHDPTSYDALVTDVIMPTISGSKLAERIALVRPDLPVLFMSGYEAGALPGGAPPPLAKPFSAQDLLDAVATIFERKS